jgi:hypothetical protein
MRQVPTTSLTEGRYHHLASDNQRTKQPKTPLARRTDLTADETCFFVFLNYPKEDHGPCVAACSTPCFGNVGSKLMLCFGGISTQYSEYSCLVFSNGLLSNQVLLT